MKKYFSLLLTTVFVLGLYGCGDNKTKEKLLGTDVIDENYTGTTTPTSGGSFTASPSAASATALYNVAFLGAGAGGVSFAPRMMRAPSTQTGGLGTPNAAGEYAITASLGMNVTLAFKYNSRNAILKTDNVFKNDEIRTFEQQSINTAGEIDLAGGISNFIAYFMDPYNQARYVPAMWSYADTGLPIEWYTIAKTAFSTGSATELSTFQTALTSFITTKFPTSMVNTVSGSIPGNNGTMSMTLTSAMPSGRPTNANPATMSGSGTMSFTNGETWAVTVNLSVGDTGPVGGTQTFTSSTGQTGTMTFSADGSMSGTIMNGATTVATIQIAANGTGTYTDVAANKTYSITGAKAQ